MCGIAGIWNYLTDRPADRERLVAITSAVAHRGPDGCGYYWGPGPGLGHRRLSIIDLDGGHQPMCNEDESIWIVFNGEIYNFPELRKDLQARGHLFRTRCDTESILHAYEEFGDACFERLRGMFALAIWDQRKQRLVLARDRMGIKPLYWGAGTEGIAFGSEIKCVAGSGQVELAIEPTAIADLFTFFYIPGPKTVYRNIYSLDPAHYLVVTRNGISKHRYWDLRRQDQRLSASQYEEQLYSILTDSVRCHLLSDVPLGAFLSGGVDSSAVVALMSAAMPGQVRTCSIGFREEKYNELPRARTVARLFATEHREYVLTPEPAKVIQDLANHYDQPFPDHSSIPTYYVSRLARHRVKVVLSGDGGDENFGGYKRYLRYWRMEQIRRRIPGTLLLPFRERSGGTGGDFGSRVQRGLHQLALDCREAYLRGITVADATRRAQIFSPELQRELAGYDPLDAYRAICDQAPTDHPLGRILYLDMRTYLVDDILAKVDRASMANSLEVRVPLLDHHVVEFAFAVPFELKIRNGEPKFLLRQCMARHLPASHLRLPKKGFATPMTDWMRGELRQWAREAILDEPAILPFLNRPEVEHLWNAFQRGQDNLLDLISVLFSFGLWARSRGAHSPVRNCKEYLPADGGNQADWLPGGEQQLEHR